MSNKYNKYVSFITVITILVLLLLTTNKIKQEVFLLLFIPLAIAMLVFGFLELKKTLKNKKNIDLHASEIKIELKLSSLCASFINKKEQRKLIWYLQLGHLKKRVFYLRVFFYILEIQDTGIGDNRSKITFSTKEIKILQKNPKVKRVSERAITYTDAFKNKFMDEFSPVNSLDKFLWRTTLMWMLYG